MLFIFWSIYYWFLIGFEAHDDPKNWSKINENPCRPKFKKSAKMLRMSSKINGSSLQKSSKNQYKSDAKINHFFDSFFIDFWWMLAPCWDPKSLWNQLKLDIIFYVIFNWFCIDFWWVSRPKMTLKIDKKINENPCQPTFQKSAF